MTSNQFHGISLLMIFATALTYSVHTCSALRYQEVLEHIAERRNELSKHPFFAFLADGSVAPERRMQFAPYWTFFALGAADIFDYWIRYENPRNALEERVNKFVREDDFHYNLFLHDLKTLGYSLDRYGSFEAVIRHLWSDETHAIRQFFYHWAAVTVIYRDDPMVTLTTFEAGEAGLIDVFGIAFNSIYGDGGLTELKYFGKEHMDLEMSHNVTAWFVEESSEGMSEEEKEKEEESLAGIEITEEQRELYIKVADDMLDRYAAMYDALYDIEVSEDTICPEKFKVEGYPTLDRFPAKSSPAIISKDEF